MRLFKRLKRADHRKPVREMYLKPMGDESQAIVLNNGETITVHIGGHEIQMRPSEAIHLGRRITSAAERIEAANR